MRAAEESARDAAAAARAIRAADAVEDAAGEAPPDGQDPEETGDAPGDGDDAGVPADGDEGAGPGDDAPAPADGAAEGLGAVAGEQPGVADDDDTYADDGSYGSLGPPGGADRGGEPEADPAQDDEPEEKTPALLRDPDYPMAGAQLTHPLLPIAVGSVLVLFEATLGARAIQPITALGNATATFAAAALVLVLTFAADATGRMVAPLLMRWGRRPAMIALSVMAVATLGCIGWTVVSFGGARATNIAYQDARVVPPAARGSLGFAPARSASEARAALKTPAAVAATPTGPKRPDAAFAVPLTLVALLVTFLLSVRCSLAEPWRRRIEQERLQAEAERELEERERADEEERREREEEDRARDAAEKARMVAERQAIELAAREARAQLTAAQQSRADSAAQLDASELALTALLGARLTSRGDVRPLRDRGRPRLRHQRPSVAAIRHAAGARRTDVARRPRPSAALRGQPARGGTRRQRHRRAGRPAARRATAPATPPRTRRRRSAVAAERGRPGAERRGPAPVGAAAGARRRSAGGRRR